MWAKDLKIGNQAINARIETAATKPLFRGAWKSRRCLIPASGFYEWRALEVPGKAKPAKLPFYISRLDGLPLTFAGLWERWKDGMLSCTILTCEALDKTGHPDKPDSPSTGSIAISYGSILPAHCYSIKL